jgi:hypothetical protein
VVPRFPIPRGFPEIPRNSPKIGDRIGDGDGFCRRLRKFWGKLPNFPQKLRLGWEDIFGEYLGPIGDGDRLEIGEFSGKIPQNSQKIGVGMVKTFLGNIGDQLGTGTD